MRNSPRTSFSNPRPCSSSASAEKSTSWPGRSASDDDQLDQWAQAAGYVAAFTIERRPVTRSDKIMALPRFIVTDLDRGEPLRVASGSIEMKNHLASAAGRCSAFRHAGGNGLGPGQRRRGQAGPGQGGGARGRARRHDRRRRDRRTDRRRHRHGGRQDGADRRARATIAPLPVPSRCRSVPSVTAARPSRQATPGRRPPSSCRCGPRRSTSPSTASARRFCSIRPST